MNATRQFAAHEPVRPAGQAAATKPTAAVGGSASSLFAEKTPVRKQVRFAEPAADATQPTAAATGRFAPLPLTPLAEKGNNAREPAHATRPATPYQPVRPTGQTTTTTTQSTTPMGPAQPLFTKPTTPHNPLHAAIQATFAATHPVTATGSAQPLFAKPATTQEPVRPTGQATTTTTQPTATMGPTPPLFGKLPTTLAPFRPGMAPSVPSLFAKPTRPTKEEAAKDPEAAAARKAATLRFMAKMGLEKKAREAQMARPPPGPEEPFVSTRPPSQRPYLRVSPGPPLGGWPPRRERRRPQPDPVPETPQGPQGEGGRYHVPEFSDSDSDDDA